MTRPNALPKSNDLDRSAALDWAARALRDMGIEDARREARLLLEHCAGSEAGDGQPLPAGAIADLEALIERRRNREPVSQILGQWEFWSLPFFVTAATLTPRPDTETLVQAALDLLPDRGATLRLLDLGTGSGCLLLALLHDLPAARGLGIDRSPEALAVAERNASALGLADRAQFALGDWAEGLSGSFDLIVSNPPYIPRDEIPSLMPEVSRHEPLIALDGGVDGLDCYRQMAPQIAARLAPGGLALLEVGQGQADSAAAILAAAGLEPAGVRADLGGRKRCVIFRNDKQ
jgi:release factor glutamine methyltransferase